MRAAAALGAALVLAACAPVPSRPDLLGPSHARAKRLEADGQLRPALLEWKVARAIDPNDAETRANEARLAARIEGLVAARVTEARGALQRGAPLQARRLLLSVLALDPTNTTAAELLRGIGDVDLPPGKPLVVGALLRIPEIPGVPFYAPGRKSPPAATPSMPRGPDRAVPSPDEPPEVNPLLADLRDAVDRKEFTSALADIDRYLAENPRDREATELKKLALYRQGQAALEEKKYDDSYRALTQLAKIQPDYQDVARLLPEARQQVIDRHYQEGIRLFREEKLPEAIAEWKTVLEMDPQNVNARRNLEQAERLVKGLEQRKSR